MKALDSGPTKSPDASLRYALWVWSYAWTVSLLVAMEMNLLSATFPSMAEDLAISISLVSLVLGASQLIRLASAFISGVFGDELGRVNWIRISSVLFIISSILVATIWNFWSFTVFILFASFAQTLPMNLTAVLVAEHAPTKHRGWLTGTSNSFAFAATLGPIIGSWALAAGLGWRFPWIIIVVPAVVNLIQSWFIREPERFLEMKKVKQALKRGETISNDGLKYPIDTEKVKESSFRQLFNKDLRKTNILLAIWLSFATIAWSNGSSYWTLFFSTDKGLTYLESVSMFGYLWLIAEPGFLAGSFLSQIMGGNRVISIGCAIAAMGNFIMVQFAYGFNQILLSAAIMMIGQGLIWGSFPSSSMASQ